MMDGWLDWIDVIYGGIYFEKKKYGWSIDVTTFCNFIYHFYILIL